MALQNTNYHGIKGPKKSAGMKSLAHCYVLLHFIDTFTTHWPWDVLVLLYKPFLVGRGTFNILKNLIEKI